MKYSVFSKNGHIVSIDEAVIPIENIAYQYGFGVYESIKVRNGIVYFLVQHVQRLLQSAEIIRLDHPFTNEEIKQYITELLAALVTNESKNDSAFADVFSCTIKVLLIGGKNKSEAQLYLLPLAPLYPHRKLYIQGVKTMSVSYERIFPNAKTLNMLPSYLAFKKANEAGCYDALLVNKQGNILEGTRTNFFTIKDRTLFTPGKRHILDGVTRQTVLKTALNLQFICEEWDISLAELKEYDGAFLTSTNSKIMPIRQIDTFIFPDIADAIKILMKAYDEFLKQSKGIFGI